MQRIIFLILFISFSSVCADEKKDRPNNHDGHCDLCGSCQCIRRMPVAKPIMKEVRKTCIHTKCEDVIIPGPACLCGEKQGSDECGCFWYPLWKPTWAKVIKKTIPVTTEVTRKVPSYEWVIEERCNHCR